MLRSIHAILLLALSSLLGCGPSQIPVEGKVILDGQPLTTGNVAFHPVGTAGESEAVVGRSEIDSDGNYRLHCNGKPGVAAGSYKVVVLASKPSNPSDPYSLPVSLLDKKFTSLSTSPLTVDVAPGNSPEKYTLSVSK